ncbi:hypothetical protein D0T66_07550 [Dysgonomonas sp. 25]|nr:hypothetical protein [Dysgonomonas sp. 25]
MVVCQYHGALYGYRAATSLALDAWVKVYNGSLGITLTDTYTTDAFFSSFNLQQAKLFDGVRCDSGDPLTFADKAVRFYEQMRIDPTSKTIVFSDSLDVLRVKEIKSYVRNRIHDTYGIGTFFSNDVGAKPLNIVIKLSHVKADSREGGYLEAIKLSDASGKHTGDIGEIAIAKQTLGIK